MKGLFAFADEAPVPASKPTCVVAEELTSQASQVYLASEKGFSDYCQTCQKLVMIQETDFQTFTIRVFCAVGKCVK